MTRKEIIDGLKFTVDMFLFDPSTGETYTEPRNDMDKTTIDACKGAIELLEQVSCEDCISRQKAIDAIDALYLDGDSVVSYLANADGDTLIGKYQAITALDDLPSVTPQPSAEKTAEWIFIDNKKIIAKCSNCALLHDTMYGTRYCPNCGAKMKGKAEREKAEQTTEEPIKHFGSIECPNCGRLLMLEEQTYGWCKGCKEYDTEKHCCHRYSSFIRESLQDNINAVLEDIKAEIEKEMSNAKSTGYLNGLNMALMIINEKHISGKENE